MTLESPSSPEQQEQLPIWKSDATKKIGAETASALYDNLLAGGGALDVFKDAEFLSLQSAESVRTNDVEAVWGLLHERLPVEGNEWRRGRYQHLIDTASYASRIAAKVGQKEAGLTPQAFALMGILRNSGQLLGLQEVEYYRKSQLARIICNQLGIPSEMKAALLPAPYYVNVGKNASKADVDAHIIDIQWNLSTEQQILEISGVRAKRSPNHISFTHEEVIVNLHEKTRRSQETLAQMTPSKTLHWLSSNAVTGTFTPEFSQGYSGIYAGIVEDLKAMGADMNQIQNEIVLAEQHQPINPDMSQDQLTMSAKALTTFLRSLEQ